MKVSSGKRKRNSIKIIQKKKKGKEDSLFYDGEIACAEKNGWLFSLIADGDVCIELDGKRYGTAHTHCDHHLEDLFEKRFNLTDRKLKMWEKNERISWMNNNWFEIIFRKKGEDTWGNDIGEVEYDYDGAIQLLKDYMNDERFKEVKK